MVVGYEGFILFGGILLLIKNDFDFLVIGLTGVGDKCSYSHLKHRPDGDRSLLSSGQAFDPSHKLQTEWSHRKCLGTGK